MKTFFWDFDDQYESFSTEGFPEKRRDFVDYFFDAQIPTLMENFPNASHGIITNGDLMNQCQIFMDSNLMQLFKVDFLTSPSIEAKALAKNFPILMISDYFKMPITLNQDRDYLNLVFSLNKPDKYMYEITARSFSLDPKDCYVVGTSYKDFLAGKNAGMNTIHIRGWENNGKLNVQNLKNKPDYTINKSNMFKGLAKIMIGLE